MTLQVGDRAYTEAAWVSQYAGHPWAPFSFLVAECLRQAYVHTQAHGMLLFQQPYWHNTQDLSGDLSLTRAFTLSTATEWGGVGRAWAEMPLEVSHVDALVIFAIQTMRETQVDLQVTVIDASTNTDSATSSTVITEDARDGAARTQTSSGVLQGSPNDLARLYDAEAPFLGAFRVHMARVRVPLSNVATDQPGKCEIRVEARANGWNDGTQTFNQPIGFMPLWVEARAAMDDFDTVLVDTAEGGTTLSPLALSLGQDVTYEDLRRLHRQEDWAMAYRPETHLNLCVAGDGWDDYSGGASAAVGPFNFNPGAGAEEIIITDLWVNAEHAQNGGIECGAECFCQPGETVRLSFALTGSVGTITVNVDCSDAENGTEVTDSVDFSGATNGGEWVVLQITMQRTVGSAADNEVRQLRASEKVLTSLPGPQND